MEWLFDNLIPLLILVGVVFSKIAWAGQEVVPVPEDPVAVATASPSTVKVGETVSFDGSGSYDKDIKVTWQETESGWKYNFLEVEIDGVVKKWEWDFGDEGSGSGKTISHNYQNPGEYTITLSITADHEETASTTVTVKVIEPYISPDSREIEDGQDGGSFEVKDDEGVSEWQWGWEVLGGAGNNPNVNFNPDNGDPTTVTTKWYAHPDDPYGASNSSTYTIKCQVTINQKKIAAEPGELTVTVPWDEGGYVGPLNITGRPTFASRIVRKGLFRKTEWYIKDQGAMERTEPQVTIYVPTSSQFRNKTEVHENVHVEQYETGMLSDLWVVDDLWDRVKDLTAPTKEAINNAYNREWEWYRLEQLLKVWERKDAVEREAYSISNPISPQYLYMKRLD
ncbi:MAG TPA: PKD domain-containing protein [bacterium]|nr:PKD domain-containing protein [bacterium]